MLFELELEVMQVNQTSFSRDWQQIRTEKSLQTFIKHSNLCTFRCLYLVLAKWDLFSNTFWVIVTSFQSPSSRADGKSQVRQCLGFCTADLWSSLAYESAEQKPNIA